MEIPLRDEIERLKKERNAVILAHNYQRLEVQDVADYLGDSLHLAKVSAKLDNPVIVFCGVRFMAETAKILSPDKTVLHPVPGSSCPMADMVSPEDVEVLRQLHPDAPVVSYVNTNADVKAVSDIICTSRNAVELVSKLGVDEVIFVPDMNLAAHVAKHLPGVKVHPGQGYCYVHADMSVQDVKEARALHPDAVLVVHPECPPEVCDLADHVLSTSGMVELAGESPAKEFIIGTEIGLIERLRILFPDKKFYSLGPGRVCHNMKKIELKDVYDSLLHMRYPVEVDPDTAEKARRAIQRMLDMS